MNAGMSLDISSDLYYSDYNILIVSLAH